MAAGDKKYLTNDQDGNDVLSEAVHFTFGGELADATAYTFIWVTPKAIEVTDVQLALDITGAGGTDVEVDVLDDGTSVLTALPALAVAAANEAVARVGASGTGITATVVKSDGSEVIASGSTVKITLTADGTFSTQPKDATITLVYKEQQDFDPQP
jgi:hypothetical protein